MVLFEIILTSADTGCLSVPTMLKAVWLCNIILPVAVRDHFIPFNFMGTWLSGLQDSLWRTLREKKTKNHFYTPCRKNKRTSAWWDLLHRRTWSMLAPHPSFSSRRASVAASLWNREQNRSENILPFTFTLKKTYFSIRTAYKVNFEIATFLLTECSCGASALLDACFAALTPVGRLDARGGVSTLWAYI